MRDIYDGKRRLAAYHEAGHAVLACLFGFDLQSVEILPASPKADSALLCAWMSRQPPLNQTDPGIHCDDVAAERVESFAMFALAGDCVERHAGLTNLRHGMPLEDGTRVRRFLAARIPTAEAAATLLQQLTDRTIQCVEREWPRIERVATALLARSRLTGDEVRAIVTA